MESNTKSDLLREVDRLVARRADTGKITRKVSIKIKNFWSIHLKPFKPMDKNLQD